MSGMITQLCHQAGALLQQGNFGKAEQIYRAALKSDRNSFEALCGLAQLELRRGAAEAAVMLLRKALNQMPNVAEAHFTLGDALAVLGRTNEAIARYEKALSLKPSLPAAHNNLANLLAAVDRRQDAIRHYERAISILPSYVEAHANLANLMKRMGRLEDAVALYERALGINPNFASVRSNLANALDGLGRHAEAIEQFRAALAINPNMPVVHFNLGRALLTIGRIAEAKEALAKAVELDQQVPAYYLELFNAATVSADDQRVGDLEKLAKDVDRRPVDEQIQTYFALAKAYSDRGDREQSFEYLERGNALARQRTSYDEAEELGLLRRIEAVFTPDLVQRCAASGYPADRPIFIVGMPRSGSTLIEQILASHPDVTTIGESPIFLELVESFTPADGTSRLFPDVLASWTHQRWQELGRAYMARIEAAARSQKKRVVDKMLGNYRYAGLIKIALPTARIIHARRDPVDTCLSCFSTLFSGDLPQTYELGELGRYYRAYATLMAHWHHVLPPDAILEMQYEEIVGDFEAQARRLVSYCGLEWDAACLSFYQNSGAVRTASVVQVRQPIYHSSVRRWRPSGDRLRPLLDGLGDLAQSDPPAS